MNKPPDHSEPARHPPGPGHSTPSVDDRNLSRLVEAVFGGWNASGLPFLVLRNYEQLPEHVDNDLDILVPASQLEMAERILVEAAIAAGYQLHNRAEFVPVSLFFHHTKTRQQVQVDLFTSLGFRALEILSTKDVLGRRIKQHSFAVPQAADEAIVNLLTRLLYNGYVKEKYRPAILECFRAESETVQNRLTAAFGPAWAVLLVESVLAQQWNRIEQNAQALRRALLSNEMRRRPVSLMATTAKDCWRLLRRWLRAPGLHIAVLGPDGCGKSTVIPKITDGLRFTFQPGKGLLLHWKPVVFGKSNRQSTGVVTDPHARPPRNPLASLIYFAFHWLEFLVGSTTGIHRVKFRNGLVVSDRCYYDFLVDPKRFRLKLPVSVLQLGGQLLPQPDLVLLLDAPTAVLQSRKQEVAVAETDRQRETFLRVVKALSNGYVLDATKSPDQVAEDATRIILAHLTRRMERTPHE